MVFAVFLKVFHVIVSCYSFFSFKVERNSNGTTVSCMSHGATAKCMFLNADSVFATAKLHFYTV